MRFCLNAEMPNLEYELSAHFPVHMEVLAQVLKAHHYKIVH